MNDFPDWNDIQRYLRGAWRMMNGHADGLDELDFSEDGFWRSFHAITLSLPPLILAWIMVANDLVAVRPEAGSRLSIIGRSAFIELILWVLPFVIMAFLSAPLGVSKRFSPYVVASNWGGAFSSWLTVPATLIQMTFPDSPALKGIVGIVFFGVIVVLMYRLTHVAFKKSYAWSATFFTVLLIGTFFMLFSLQSVLGILMPALSG